MKYLAQINVMPHKELLDPQGKTVTKNMKNIDLDGVEDVRIGKRIEMLFEADSEASAKEKVETACKKLFSNVIMENYSYEIEAAQN